ncbi:hypothetical protein ABH975_004187 [Bradyrhizobium ottawaense]
MARQPHNSVLNVPATPPPRVEPKPLDWYRQNGVPIPMPVQRP